jgi:hypothetical protein
MKRTLGAALLSMALLMAGAGVAQGGTGHVVVFQGYHVIVSKKTAKRYLPGASKSFKRFAARAGARLRRTAIRNGVPAECLPRTGITVDRYHTRGFASGGLGDECDGGMAVWKRIGKRWRLIELAQEPYMCSSLNHYGVPASIFPPGTECFSSSDGATAVYHHG